MARTPRLRPAVALLTFCVVFGAFLTGCLVILILILTGERSITLTFNDYHEFWPEAVVMLAALAGSPVMLYELDRRLRHPNA